MTGTLYRGYEIVVKPIDHPIISQHKDCDIPQAFTRGRYTIYNIDIYYQGVNVWGGVTPQATYKSRSLVNINKWEIN